MPISRQATPGARRTAAPALADAGLCNGAALRRATRRVSLLYDQVLAPCGLRATQHAILVQLARAAEPPALGELARALVIDPSALAHNLRPLERDGFVALSANPRDQRCRLVRLTPAGRAKLRSCASCGGRRRLGSRGRSGRTARRGCGRRWGSWHPTRSLRASPRLRE